MTVLKRNGLCHHFRLTLLLAVVFVSSAHGASSTDWGIWIDRNVLRDGVEARQIVRRCAEYGIGRLFPHTPFIEQAPGFWKQITIPLIDECHRQGLEVHLWLDPITLASIDGRHELMQLDLNGRETVLACPANPEVRRLNIEKFVRIVKEHKIDGVHLEDCLIWRVVDDDHQVCYCDYCKKHAPIEQKNWTEWRVQKMNEYVHELGRAIKQQDPRVQFSYAARMPHASSMTMYTDWPAWCASGDLDFVVPMCYRETTAEFIELADDAVQAMAGIGTPVYLGIGTDSSISHVTPRELRSQLAETRARPVDGAVFFHYQGMDDTQWAELAAIRGRKCTPKRSVFMIGEYPWWNKDVENVVLYCKKAGCNKLIPHAPFMTGDFEADPAHKRYFHFEKDPGEYLNSFIRPLICHAIKEGMEVALWLDPVTLSSVDGRHELMQHDEKGRETVVACPANPEVRRLNIEKFVAMAKAFPLVSEFVMEDCLIWRTREDRDVCYCDYCKANAPIGKPEWTQWRIDQMNDYVENLRVALKKVRPDLQLAYAGRTPYRNSMSMYTDWQAMCRKGFLDRLYPMCYRTDVEDFRQIAASCLDVLKGIDVPISLGIGVSTTVTYTFPPVLLDQIRISRELGAEEVYFFTADEFTTEHWEALWAPGHH